MKEQIKNRIESLRVEYRTGQEVLAELEGRQAGLKITLTRISGAIQVLEELLEENNSTTVGTTQNAASATQRAAA
jgi:predicted nuclease with TOPRIM domain